MYTDRLKETINKVVYVSNMFHGGLLFVVLIAWKYWTEKDTPYHGLTFC